MVFVNLQLERLIIHEIFQREIAGPLPPALNNELADLDNTCKNELQTRIINAVGNDSHAMKMDIVDSSDGSAFNYISPIFRSDINNTSLITASHNIVHKLASVQTSRTIPGGVVVFFHGTIGAENRRCVGIIKAEKHSGFSLHIKDDVRVLQYINDLLLTPQQKLYKIAFLYSKVAAADFTGADDVEVFIFDSNNVKSLGKTAANYFYDGFMGCTFPKTSDILTKEFFFATKEFITKKANIPGQDKVDKMSALYTYLKVDTSPTISVAEFAQRYFADADLKDQYTNFMETKKVPSTTIHKSMEKLNLRNRKVRFTNEVSLYAPVDKFSENVEIIATTDTTTDIRINGKIKSET
ncbi:MAG: nucleoid-associated protein [Christensenellales bacterium]|jgi:hypothetical protein